MKRPASGVFVWCLDHPIGTVLLSLAAALLGLAAYFRLPIAPLPEVEFPTIQVSAGLPGASPDTMASSVATPLEVQFAAIPGVREMTSTSALGSVNITLQFNLETSLDSAVQEVQAAITRAGSRLPPDLPNAPVWRKVNPADSPVLILSATSDSLPLTEVSDLVETVLARQIAQIQGVGQVNLGGQRRPAVRIQASPAKLASLKLSMADIRSAVQRASRNQPTGALYGDGRVTSLETNGQLFEPADYEDLVVAWQGGAPVHLRDVAKVNVGPENEYVKSWPNGKEGVAVVVMRQPGANIVDTADRVVAALPQLRASLPAAMDVDVLIDRTRTIRASLHEIELTLIIAIVLVVGVMAIFLRQVSATAIVCAVLGVSLLTTYALMYLFGFSLNNLTLVAIVVAVGFIVDDAIVVVENIHRHLEQGETMKAAALKGVQEVGVTVVSIGVSLVAAFIPLLFMGGVVGRLFREFAVTSTVAILVSVLVSLTLAPTLASRFMRRSGAGHRAEVARGGRLESYYARGLGWALGHQRIVLASFALTIAATVAGFVLIPKGFFPLQDTAFVVGTTKAAEDISYAEMAEKHRQLADIVRADPAVLGMNHAIGTTGGSQTLANGRFWITLKDRSDRDVSASELIDRLRPKLAAVPGIQLFMRSAQDINIGAGVSPAQYQYVLKGGDSRQLYPFAQRLTSALQSNALFRDVSNDLQLGASIVRLRIDRAAAARFGLTASDIDNALYNAFGQRQINEFQTQTNQYQVVLEVGEEERGRIETLSYFHLRAPATGESIPLSAVATIEAPTNGPLLVSHHGLMPSVNLSFNLAPGVSLGPAVDELQRLERELEMPQAVQGTFLGSAQAFQESLASQPLLILAALLAVYAILGILYESLHHPLTILSTLPSAGAGALLLLALLGQDFSIMALIGVILLIGIVKKNGILMIDFALERQKQHGLSPQDAIREAALVRFRPIMMTTLAALLGALPLVFGFGTGAELRQPLGMAVVGGLLVSQALTLISTPVVYLALVRIFEGRARRVTAAREAAA